MDDETYGEAFYVESRFEREMRERMFRDHPHLIENHLPRLEDPEKVGRGLEAVALKAIMDVIDLRARAKAVHGTQNDHTNMA